MDPLAGMSISFPLNEMAFKRTQESTDNQWKEQLERNVLERNVFHCFGHKYWLQLDECSLSAAHLGLSGPEN